MTMTKTNENANESKNEMTMNDYEKKLFAKLVTSLCANAENHYIDSLTDVVSIVNVNCRDLDKVVNDTVINTVARALVNALDERI